MRKRHTIVLNPMIKPKIVPRVGCFVSLVEKPKTTEPKFNVTSTEFEFHEIDTGTKFRLDPLCQKTAAFFFSGLHYKHGCRHFMCKNCIGPSNPFLLPLRYES